MFKIFFSYKAYPFTQSGSQAALLVQCPGVGTDLRDSVSGTGGHDTVTPWDSRRALRL